MNCISLSNGIVMPMQGYGVFQLRDETQCEKCVEEALKVGYRLIDTAASYKNEEAVGRAVANSGISREELFITTKLWVQDAGYDKTLRAFEQSIQKLGLEYIDLYLLHQPFGDYYDSWRAMERLQKEGLIRSLGVSNFLPDRLADLCMNEETMPVVNQVEIHPFFQQEEAIKVMKEFHVMPQAWAPLSEGQKDIFHHTILQKIADKHGKSTVQVILRWHYERGVATAVGTGNLEHMKENMDIFDFELTDAERKQIASLDIGHSEIIDHRCVCTVKQLNGWKIHD